MEDNELNHRLRKLIGIATGQKPKKQNKTILNNNIKKTATKKQIDISLQELQMCIKYLLFDVEATRRERDKLKKMLDNQP